MRAPHDDGVVIAPERMRDLVLGLLVVEGADRVRVEVVGKLGQRMVRALQQPQAAAVRIDRDEPVQEAGLVLDPLGPAMQQQHARRGGIDLDMADPVDRLVHRCARMELAQRLVAQDQPRRAAGNVHVPDAVVRRRQRERRLGRTVAVADGLVCDIETPVVHAQAEAAVRGNHVDRHRQRAVGAGVGVMHDRAQPGIARTVVIGAAVVDQLPARQAVEPLQLRAHLPVPGSGAAYAVEALAVLQVEIADLGFEARVQVGIRHGHALRQHIAVAAVPVALVVVAEEMVLSVRAEAARRKRCIDDAGWLHG
ncbi:hypothetical protein D3C81_1044260 [compost metagenome]